MYNQLLQLEYDADWNKSTSSAIRDFKRLQVRPVKDASAYPRQSTRNNLALVISLW